MSYDKSVSDHYAHGNLFESILSTLSTLNKTPETITIEDLAPVDEFHIGGRMATVHLIEQMNMKNRGHMLDVGCGLGGAARFVASTYANQVTGIDLTAEYIETGQALCKLLKLDNKVTLQQGSALSMPFKDNSFEGAYMLHVGMNIEDKIGLFAEVYRALKSGARFAIYDIMSDGPGQLAYPVPWATQANTSKLSKPEVYTDALTNAGFECKTQTNRKAFALEFFKQVKLNTKLNGGPAPLGLHTLMGESGPTKLKNMVENVIAGYISPVEIIALKP